MSIRLIANVQVVLFILIFFSNCKQSKKGEQPLPQNSPTANLSKDVSLGLKLVEKRAKIESAKLLVNEPIIELMEINDVISLYLSAQTPNDLHDYIEYKICTEENQCSEGRFLSEEQVPVNFAGDIKIEMSACVEAYRVIDKACGQSSSTYLKLKSNPDSKTFELLLERHQLMQKLKESAQAVDAVIKEFQASTNGLNLSEDPNAKQLHDLFSNWQNYGLVRNGEFYASAAFRDFIFHPEELAEYENPQLSLAEGDNTKGNWAYPDGKIPEGKSIRRPDKQRDSLMQQAGVALLITGLSIGLVGFIKMSPNIYVENFFQRTAKHYKDLIAMHIAKGDIDAAIKINDDLAALNTRVKDQLTEYTKNKKLTDYEIGAMHKKAVSATEPFPRSQLIALYDSKNFEAKLSDKAFLQNFNSEDEVRHIFGAVKGQDQKLRINEFLEGIGHKKLISKPPAELDRMVSKQNQSVKNIAEKMEAVLKKSHIPFSERVNWNSSNEDKQRFWGVLGVVIGPALAVLGVILINEANNSQSFLAQTTLQSATAKVEADLARIQEDITMVLEQIAAIDNELNLLGN